MSLAAFAKPNARSHPGRAIGRHRCGALPSSQPRAASERFFIRMKEAASASAVSRRLAAPMRCCGCCSGIFPRSDKKRLPPAISRKADYADLDFAAVTVTCATDGNHGRSVAWGARTFGARCIIYMPEIVSPGASAPSRLTAHRCGASREASTTPSARLRPTRRRRVGMSSPIPLPITVHRPRETSCRVTVSMIDEACLRVPLHLPMSLSKAGSAASQPPYARIFGNATAASALHGGGRAGAGGLPLPQRRCGMPDACGRSARQRHGRACLRRGFAARVADSCGPARMPLPRLAMMPPWTACGFSPRGGSATSRLSPENPQSRDLPRSSSRAQTTGHATRCSSLRRAAFLFSARREQLTPRRTAASSAARPKRSPPRRAQRNLSCNS